MTTLDAKALAATLNYLADGHVYFDTADALALARWAQRAAVAELAERVHAMARTLHPQEGRPHAHAHPR